MVQSKKLVIGKKRVRNFFILMTSFFLFLFLAYKLFFYLDGLAEKKQIKEHYYITRLDENQLARIQEGDIILRRGFGYFSNIIANRLNDTPFDVTHAGILVKQNGKWAVIHSLSSDVSQIDGIQIQNLDIFLTYSHPNKIIVTRFKTKLNDVQKNIANLARYHLAKKIPFDDVGDYDDSTKMYCTELILHILDKDLRLLKIPKEKESRNKMLFTMKNMYDTNYFTFVVSTFK